MEINKVQWRMIAKGEKLPCDSFLMKKDGTMTSMVTGAGVIVGQDAYYLPVEELRSFPKEESEDEKMVKFIKKQLFNIKKTITKNYELDAKLTNAINWIEKRGEQKPDWKPSKEQMKALYDSIPENVFEISERELLLESLYRDLKKL